VVIAEVVEDVEASVEVTAEVEEASVEAVVEVTAVVVEASVVAVEEIVVVVEVVVDSVEVLKPLLILIVSLVSL